MRFAARPPSTTWELISPAFSPGKSFWAWFKPHDAPFVVAVHLPDPGETLAAGAALTMRQVLTALEIEPRDVAFWSLYGTVYDGQGGANPVLDFPIPPPPTADLAIQIHLQATMSATVPPQAMPTASGTASAAVFARMDADWNATMQLEIQLAAAAKQLNGVYARINSLNRDLTPDESRCADQLDKRDWQDARRMLRDIANRLSRILKDHTIGMTSVAGKRNDFAAIYEQYVAVRRPFEGLEQAEREFQAYRKTVLSLLKNMSSAQGAAIQDGERRAQQILARIAATTRNAQRRK